MSDMGPGGADASINVEVTADASAAAAEMEAKFKAAILAATKTNAWAQFIANAAKAFTKIGTQSQSTWRANTAAGTKSAHTIGNAFQAMFARVGRESNKAFQFNQARGSSHELTAMNALVSSLATNFEKLATDSRLAATTITQLASSARAQLNAVTQEQINARALTVTQNASANTAAQKAAAFRRSEASDTAAAARIQTALIRTSSAERIAHIQRFTQISATAIRSLTSVFHSVFLGATAAVSGFVRGAGAVIRGLRSTFQSTFSGIGQTVSRFTSAFGRAFSTIGRGVASAMSGVSRAIASALRRDEDATRQSLSRRERSMQQSAGRQRSLLSTVAVGAGIGGAGAGIVSLLTGGFERFSDEQRLNQQFLALMEQDGAAVDTLLGQISDFSRITPYDFIGVADLARTFLVMGDNADVAIDRTRLLADALAFSGSGNAELGRVQTVFAQIASQGKVMGNDFIQLANAMPALNVRQILANALTGGDTGALADMMEKDGAISADTFFDAFFGAIENDPRIDGAAEKLAGTLSGRLANLKESVDIFGSSIIGLVSGPMASAMSKVTDFLQLAGSFVSGEMFDQTPIDLGSTAVFVGLTDMQEKLQFLRDVIGNVLKALAVLAGFKIGFEIFGVIAKGIGLLFTPMGALIGIVAGVTAAFSLFYKFSDKFASTWDVMRNQIRPLVDSFKRLWTAISGRFGGGDEGTGGGIGGVITRIGDAFRYVNVWIARGLVWIRELVDGLGSLIALGREDYIDDFIVDKLFSISDAIANFLGGFMGISNEEIDAKGGGIGGLLRNTFLEPVVDFVVKLPRMLIDAVGGGIDLIGDLFGIIFGGGSDRTAEGAAAAGGSGGGTSTGNQILERLRSTFLAPVVDFFENGGFQEAYGNVRDFVGPIFTTVSDALSSAWGVIEPIVQPFIDSVSNLVDAVRKLDFGKIDVGNLLMGAGIGAAAGTLIAPGIGTAIGAAIGALSQTGLFGGLVKTIKNAYTMLIGPALVSLWGEITGGISSIFSADNIKDAGLWLLDYIRMAGKAVGQVISSPEAAAVVLGIAGVIASIVGAFTIGLGQGILHEGKRWADLFSSGLQAAWGALTDKLDFIPDPIVNAINAVLGNGAIATGVLVGATLLGGVVMKAIFGAISTAATPASIATGGPGGAANFRTFGVSVAGSLFGAVINGFKGVGKGVVSLASLVLPKLGTGDGGAERTLGSGIGARILGGMSTFFHTVTSPLGALSTRLQAAKAAAVTNFGGIGTGIATAIVGGIAAYEFANYAGKRGSAGGVLMALLGGTATGAAIGAGFGLPALGAAVGLAVSATGVYFGNASRQAEELRDHVLEITDALRGLSGGDATSALSDIIARDLTDNTQDILDWGQALIDSGFNATAFADQVVAGTATADAAFADFIAGTQAQLEDAGLDSALADKFTEAIRNVAASGDFQSAQDLLLGVWDTGLFSNEDIRKINDSMEAVDFTGIIDGSGDAEHAFNFLKSQVDATGKAYVQLAAQSEVGAAALVETVNTMDTVKEGLQGINDALRDGAPADVIADMLSNSDLTTSESFDALAQAAEGVTDKLNEARDAFIEALDATNVQGDKAATTSQMITDEIIGNLPNVADELQSIMDATGGDVVVQAQLRPFKVEQQANISEAIAAAVDEGLVFDDASMDDFLADMLADINSSDISQGGKDMFAQIIEGLMDGDFSTFIAGMTDQLTNTEVIRQAAKDYAEKYTTYLSQYVGAPQAIASHSFMGGGGWRQQPDTGAPALDTTDLSNVFNNDEASSSGQSYGRAAIDAVPEGVAAGSKAAASQISAENTSMGGPIKSAAGAVGTAAGLMLPKAMTVSIFTGRGAIIGAGSNLGRAAAIGAAIGAIQMYQAGRNLSDALARGIRASGQSAIQAAHEIANQVAQAARNTLKVHSPSQVFVDIGKQIGAGFVKGIQDSSTSMTQALSKALTDAITTATEDASEAINNANVAGELFKLLQPSTLPGGTSSMDVTAAEGDITTQLAGFLPDVRESMSGALGDLADNALADARGAVIGIGLDLAQSFGDLRGQFTEAKTAAGAITAWDAAAKKLREQLASGQLATLARDRERGEAYKDLIADQNVLNDKIARLRVQLNNGTIAGKNATERLATFNEKVKDLKDSFAATTVERYHDELDRINRAFKDGSLGAAEYKERLQDLGARPTALSFEQKNLLATGTKTLNLGTIAGRANRDTLSDALGKIREFGQAALEAGTPLATVITQMTAYTKKVTDQARTMGLATKDVNALVSAFGLTSTQLTALKASFFSLSTSTVQGAANVATLNEQLGGIRDYASTLLEAGDSSDAVISKVKTMRDQLVTAAKAFGFNVDSINALVDAAGLSDSALANFIQQLKDYTDAANAAAAATGANTDSSTTVARPIGELHVHVPYGDPEAVALATANRIAFAGPASW